MITFKDLKIGDKFRSEWPTYQEINIHEKKYLMPCNCVQMKISENLDDGVELHGEKFNIIGVFGDCAGWFGQIKYIDDEVHLVDLEIIKREK